MSTAVIESNGKASTEPATPSIATALYGGKSGSVPTVPSTEQPVSTDGPGTQPTSDKTSSASPAVEQSQTSDPAKGKSDTSELEKQLKTQSDANRRLGKENRETREQLEKALKAIDVLTAKINGTYEEPAEETPEQIKAREEASRKASNFQGREIASAKMAMERYGKEAVQAAIYDDESTIAKMVQVKPWIANRISESELPAMEAMQIIAEEQWIEKYGSDPSKWIEKISAELKPQHLEEFRKQASVTQTGAPGPTVSEARGEGGTSKQPKTLQELLYGGKPKKE